MHNVSVRQNIVERVLARRGRYHWFDRLDPRRTALVVIDMQDTFCAPGAPAEVPQARGIVDKINYFTQNLRALTVPIIWALHANSRSADRSDWELFFNHVVADDVRAKTLESLAPGKQKVWSGLQVGSRRHPDRQEPVQRLDCRLIRARTHPAQLGDRYGPDRRHQDQCLLRVDRARRHDA